MATADFNINASGPEDVGYDATNAEVLTLQLANLPTTAYRVQFSVTQFSKDMPALVFSPVSGEPVTPGGSVTVTAPALGVHSFNIDCVVDNGVDQEGRQQPTLRSSRGVVIRSVNDLAKIVPAERTEYDATHGWTAKHNEMVDTFDAITGPLATATPNPTPDTVVLRDDPGAGAGFGYLWTGSTPASTGHLRMTDGHEITAKNGGVDVTLLKCTTGQIEIGDAIDADAIVATVKANGTISSVVSGTGAASLVAQGAGSQVAIATNSTTVLTATNSTLTLAGTVGTWNAGAALNLTSGAGGAGDIILSVTAGERLRVKTAGLEFANTFDPEISVASLGAGNGRNLTLSAGDLSAGAGTGGTVVLAPGTNAGGNTGNVVAFVPFGSGGTSGMLKVYDGTNTILDIYGTAVLATMAFDRPLSFTVAGATTLSVTVGALTLSSAGDTILSVGGSERARVRATGIEFPANSANAKITQAASNSPQTLTISAASAPSPGGGGIDGGHVRLEVGSAGSGTDDVGEIQFNLKLSNGVSGVWRLEVPGAAVGDTIATFQYTDSTATSLWSHNTTFSIQTSAFNVGVADDAFATIATTGAQNVGICGGGTTNGAGVMAFGAASAAPTGAQTDPQFYREGGAIKGIGTGGTITTVVTAEPHCPRCGADFAHQWRNDAWGKRLAVCVPCMLSALESKGVNVSLFAFEREGF